MAQKKWYDSFGFGVSCFNARDGFTRHLEPFINEDEDYDDEYEDEDEKDILITSLLKYLDLEIRNMITDNIIDVEWTIDLEKHTFSVYVYPIEDTEEFDFYLSLHEPTDHEREKYLAGIAMSIAADFLKLEKDLYEKYQKEMVS